MANRGLKVFWDGVNCGKMRVVRHYMEHGATPEIRDAGGRTPLHYAGMSGLMEMARYLIDEKGAKVNSKSELGMTPLLYAARNDHLEMCGYLLRKGADIGAEDKDGRTPLHLAARFGHPTVCDFLLTNGADPEVCDNDGNCADDEDCLCYCADEVDRIGIRKIFKHHRDERRTTGNKVKEKLREKELDSRQKGIDPVIGSVD